MSRRRPKGFIESVREELEEMWWTVEDQLQKLMRSILDWRPPMP